MSRKSASGKTVRTKAGKPKPRTDHGADARPAGPEQELVQQSVLWVTVDENSEGQRLDNFLLAQLRGVPRSVIYRIVRKGEVRVNKGRVKPDTRLALGDQVRIPPVARKEKEPQAAPGSRVQGVIEAAVVFEDDQLLVVNKPSGIAVHGGSGLSFGLIEVLRAARPETRFLELVHRLDRDTSGLVMIAKKRSALRYLQDELRQRRIRKQYHALVAGDWPDRLRRVEEPLLRYEMPNGERRVRVDEAGKASLTTFSCLRRFRGYSLVEASPVTGRTHQIRVHAACSGHPIAGDDKYMDDVSLKAFRSLGGQRLMLHARALELTLPGSGEKVRFEAPYDEVFSHVLSKLEVRATGVS
ncbi:ribosomal large subunit pseudouridine synthase C [Streptosporangium jomthongense]|uniref:Pseudouridine synthase n=1 Tax=Marinobacter aromaticivorans TaxID=1494078 RepID=A0ABW2IS89_9GAMM|nr:23S rRNA pseudouridine(955/2504/2580) synthase RluC [Marinobacter aromaticivorans]GGE59459.1 ribosomal large subunit pseudouridine synthase C [Streptosporangium jomthongense]